MMLKLANAATWWPSWVPFPIPGTPRLRMVVPPDDVLRVAGECAADGSWLCFNYEDNTDFDYQASVLRPVREKYPDLKIGTYNFPNTEPPRNWLIDELSDLYGKPWRQRWQAYKKSELRKLVNYHAPCYYTDDGFQDRDEQTGHRWEETAAFLLTFYREDLGGEIIPFLKVGMTRVPERIAFLNGLGDCRPALWDYVDQGPPEARLSDYELARRYVPRAFGALGLPVPVVPTPPPPPPPADIVVGPSPPPAELRVGKGEPAAKIQKLLDDKGKAHVEYGAELRLTAPVKVPPGALIGTYGNPKDGRPRLLAETDGFHLSGAHGATIRGFAIRPNAGIPGDAGYDPDWAKDFKDPARGVQIGGDSDNVTLEDLDVRGFEDNVSLYHPGGTSRNVRVIGCVLAYALSRRGYGGQGLFMASFDGLLIERCVLAYNGWYKGIRSPAIYQHGLYGSAEHGAKNLTVRDTLTVGNGSFGLQCRPAASKIQRCLSIDDGIGWLLNGPGEAELVDSGHVAGHFHAVDYYHGQGGVEWCAERGRVANTIFVGGPKPGEVKDKAGKVRKQSAMPVVHVHRRRKDDKQPWQWQGKVSCDVTGNTFCGVNGKPVQVDAQANVTATDKGNKVRPDKPDLSWVDAFVKRAVDGKADAAEGLKLLRQAAGV